MDQLVSPNEVTISLIQMAMTQSPQENLDHAVALIHKAITQGAQIICLPELFRSPYFCTTPHTDGTPLPFLEELPGVVVPTLADIARGHGVVIIAGSVYEKATNGCLNTAVVIDTDGSVKGSYSKTHIPHDPGFYERDYFAAATNPLNPIETTFGKVGVLICFDQWFPEAARTLALRGAEYLFYPTAIGRVHNEPMIEGDWQDAWETVQRGHAIANSVVVAATNRVGTEGYSTFWGGSFITNQFGAVLARGAGGETIVTARVNRNERRRVREEWGFMAARRPDLYEEVTVPVTEIPTTPPSR